MEFRWRDELHFWRKMEFHWSCSHPCNSIFFLLPPYEFPELPKSISPPPPPRSLPDPLVYCVRSLIYHSSLIEGGLLEPDRTPHQSRTETFSVSPHHHFIPFGDLKSDYRALLAQDDVESQWRTSGYVYYQIRPECDDVHKNAVQNQGPYYHCSNLLPHWCWN
ncbi:hypothetical protein KSP40_PGU011225 [Platanthera guangdongensis]|uniref:Uncharacterized protein n=1 Tax=Platanthera guangdongensis TaxID=2320717 RepID=A0ABR2MAW9_9ASPA